MRSTSSPARTAFTTLRKRRRSPLEQLVGTGVEREKVLASHSRTSAGTASGCTSFISSSSSSAIAARLNTQIGCRCATETCAPRRSTQRNSNSTHFGAAHATRTNATGTYCTAFACVVSGSTHAPVKRSEAEDTKAELSSSTPKQVTETEEYSSFGVLRREEKSLPHD